MTPHKKLSTDSGVATAARGPSQLWTATNPPTTKVRQRTQQRTVFRRAMHQEETNHTALHRPPQHKPYHAPKRVYPPRWIQPHVLGPRWVSRGHMTPLWRTLLLVYRTRTEAPCRTNPLPRPHLGRPNRRAAGVTLTPSPNICRSPPQGLTTPLQARPLPAGPHATTLPPPTPHCHPTMQQS